jgi:hypothetical protein
MPETTDPDIIPISWAIPPKPYEIQLALAPLDEIGIPYEKRGLRLTVPKAPDEFPEFARAVAVQVESTILHILKEERNA